ncbi:MAG: glycosyltransferase family 61 protein [Paracoccus sp. (in: a-proteobacteria)]
MFDPEKKLADKIAIFENALIVPQGEARRQGIAMSAGIYDKTGSYQPIGQCWRNSALPTTFRPGQLPSETPKERYGTWIFGGLLYNHFGHALLESTARLWARDFVPEAKGVLFLLKKANRPKRFVESMMPMLTMFGGNIGRVMPVVEPTHVERLVVAPQAFGTGDMIAGGPEFRNHIHRNLAGQIKPEGAEKVYISRSQLYSKRGRYLAEDLIEEYLAAEGYRIFHPQNHPLEEQAAQYAMARRVISSDSSALHLAAFFAGPESRLAIILRRPATVLDDYLTQYHWFASIKPDVIDVLTGQYFRPSGGKPNQLSELYSEIDLPKLANLLAKTGYIHRPSAWAPAPAQHLDSERIALSQRLGIDIVSAEINT